MASLWKRKNSPFWVACFTGPDGQRLKKSTKQTDKSKALAVVLEWERAARNGKQRTLTESQARKVVSQIVECTSGEPLAFHTTEDWLNEWLKGKEQSKTAGTAERYGHVIRDFIEHLANRAKLGLAHITPKDIRTFRDAEKKSGKSAKTCNLAVKIVGAAFNAAKRQGFIPSNPAEAIESLPHQAEAKGTFTPEQVADLLNAAPSTDWRGAILLAYYTGARLRDVANMRWDAIDLAGKLISFTAQKTKRQVVIPVHPELEPFLLEIAGDDSPKANLFATLAGRPTGGAHGLSRRFADIMAKAGISADEARPRKEGKGRAVSKLSFHSFRHGFNSAMANKGIAQEVRQKLTGHASAEMNKVYTHHEKETLRTAIAAIPSIKKGAKSSGEI